MDIFAHGLWTNALYETIARKKKMKRSRAAVWTAIFFGIAPDLVSFGPAFIVSALSIFSRGFHFGRPAAIPNYIHTLYNFTHSMVIFAAAFGVVWLVMRRPPLLMGGWGLHIFIDIFSHTEQFFPTPFLFPLSNFHVSVVSWGNPIFMAVNYSCILIAYLILYGKRKNKPTQP